MKCDICGEKCSVRTEIFDRRYKKPISNENARVCNTCFNLWASDEIQALQYRIKMKFNKIIKENSQEKKG